MNFNEAGSDWVESRVLKLERGRHLLLLFFSFLKSWLPPLLLRLLLKPPRLSPGIRNYQDDKKKNGMRKDAPLLSLAHAHTHLLSWCVGVCVCVCLNKLSIPVFISP